MAILPIYTYGQPVLHKKAKPVRGVDEELITFIKNMFETMHHANGIGLAANQVGDLRRVIVLDISDTSDDHVDEKPLVLLNPEIVEEEGTWVMEEGCLSIPHIRDEIERAKKIRVRYKDLAFHDRELVADGLLARVILHEVDHLNGVLFIDHLGAVKQKLLKGRLNKIRKGEVEIDYPFVAEEVSST
ncbi:MAG: peptide deformylase [Bacteroidota bacterium]